MKITKEQLRRLIKEELEQMDEAGMDFDYEKRQFIPSGGEESEERESDPLRDAVRQFVDAVKDHI
jgi:hypothetical protein